LVLAQRAVTVARVEVEFVISLASFSATFGNAFALALVPFFTDFTILLWTNLTLANRIWSPGLSKRTRSWIADAFASFWSPGFASRTGLSKAGAFANRKLVQKNASGAANYWSAKTPA
jgi:hypothetical protein